MRSHRRPLTAAPLVRPAAGATPGKPVETGDRRRLPILLRRAWYGLNQAFRRRIAHTGLTPDQFTVMRNLVEGDPAGLTQSELTRRMSSDPNTIAALIERMEVLGWVERRPHEHDRRAQRIRPRPSGRRRYRQLRRIAQALQREVLSVLPDSRREEMLADLETMAEACRRAVEMSPRK